MRIKKTIIGFLGLLGLLSCTVESELPQSDNLRAVGFGSYTEQFQTRANAAKEKRAIGDGESMGVYAYLHDNGTWADANPNTPNFMWNQQATYYDELEAFLYNPLKYWPNEEADKVSFIAYYPFTDPSISGNPENPTSPDCTGLTPQLANDGTGLPSFNFTVNDTPANQVDFLVSDLITNLPKTRDTEDDPHTAFNDLNIYDRVHFIFRHALSKVEFRVVADAEIFKDIVKFKLSDLNITNIYKNGTLTTSYDGTKTSLMWSGQSEKHGSDATSPQYKHDFTTYVPQLLMPQPIGNDVELNLSYSITFKSDGTTYKYEDDTWNAKEDYTYSNTATLQLNEMKMTGTNTPLTQWLPNHHYIYTIRLRANRIEFTAQVVEWGDEDTWLGDFVNQ